MVVAKEGACSTMDASRVAIHPSQPDIWTMVPVRGEQNTYNIIAKGRKTGCLRYIGAPAACTDNYVTLYKGDDGSGAQRWIIKLVNPAKPPPRSPPPPVSPPSPTTSPPPSPSMPPSPSPPPSPSASPSPSPPPSPSPSPSLPSLSPTLIPQPPSPVPSPPPGITGPSAPTHVVASPATVTWQTPTSDGGAPIIGYKVTCTSTPGGVKVGPELFLGASTTSTGVGGFTGLSSSATYTCSVVAFNSYAPSAAAVSNSFTMPDLPSAPGAPTFTPSSVDFAKATITWGASASDGGSPITHYEVTCNSVISLSTVGPQKFTGTTTGTDGFTGLSSNTNYACSVVAVNIAGAGPTSALSNSVTTLPAHVYILDYIGNTYLCPYGPTLNPNDCTILSDPTWTTPSVSDNPSGMTVAGQSAFVSVDDCSTSNCISGCSVAEDGTLTGCALTGAFTNPQGITSWGSTVFVAAGNEGALGVCTHGPGNTLTGCVKTQLFQYVTTAFGVAAVSATTVYVTDQNAGYIFECTVDAAFGATCIAVTTYLEISNGIGGIGVVGDAVITVDGGRHKIYTCDRTASPPWTCTAQYTGSPSFDPQAVAVWRDQVYITALNGDVYQATVTGLTVSTPVLIGSGFGTLLYGLALG